MATPSPMFPASIKFILLIAILLLLVLILRARAQEIKTMDLSTEDNYPLTVRLGSACLIELPTEPITTSVGDPAMWYIETNGNFVSVKPIQKEARDTSLAIVTRAGTVNFSLSVVPDSQPFTQGIRVNRITSRSRLPAGRQPPSESLAEVLIREIKVAKNWYGYKTANRPEVQRVQEVKILSEREEEHCRVITLQAFRFQETGHVLLHFLTENTGKEFIAIDHRKTVVTVGEVPFIPISVSLGKQVLRPGASAQNFLVLNGGNGLSLKNDFKIHLFRMSE
jgi:hypothetical protein